MRCQAARRDSVNQQPNAGRMGGHVSYEAHGNTDGIHRRSCQAGVAHASVFRLGAGGATRPLSVSCLIVDSGLDSCHFDPRSEWSASLCWNEGADNAVPCDSSAVVQARSLARRATSRTRCASCNDTTAERRLTALGWNDIYQVTRDGS